MFGFDIDSEANAIVEWQTRIAFLAWKECTFEVELQLLNAKQQLSFVTNQLLTKVIEIMEAACEERSNDYQYLSTLQKDVLRHPVIAKKMSTYRFFPKNNSREQTVRFLEQMAEDERNRGETAAAMLHLLKPKCMCKQ